MTEPTRASKRRRILEAIKARLEAIVEGDRNDRGAVFETNLGQAVYLEETPALGPDDANAAIAIVVDEDELLFGNENTLMRLPLQIQALAYAELESPWVVVEMVIADIKRAIELNDRSLDGLAAKNKGIERGETRGLERQDGSLVVGAYVRYWVPYLEGWGTP